MLRPYILAQTSSLDSISRPYYNRPTFEVILPSSRSSRGRDIIKRIITTQWYVL